MLGVELIRNTQVFLPVRRHLKKDETYIDENVECLELDVYMSDVEFKIDLKSDVC